MAPRKASDMFLEPLRPFRMNSGAGCGGGVGVVMFVSLYVGAGELGASMYEGG